MRDTLCVLTSQGNRDEQLTGMVCGLPLESIDFRAYGAHTRSTCLLQFANTVGRKSFSGVRMDVAKAATHKYVPAT